jgi:ribosomal protein L29
MKAAQQKVKAYQLRDKSDDDLLRTLTQYRSELVALRTSKVSSAP